MSDWSQVEWADTLEPPALSRDQVHLWKMRLDREKSDQVFEPTLAPDELARARRFHFERDRRRFTAARGQLRTILARYLGTDPRDLLFSYGPRGKPFLDQPSNGASIRFNLSHSGERALLGVTLDRAIGVDLEEVHSLDEAENIAARFFSPNENTTLLALPHEERLEAFYCCWTLKEAYVKATGDGLSRPTQSFDVAFGCGGEARLVSVDWDCREPSRWSLLELAPETGYVGGLAVEGRNCKLICFDFSDCVKSS